MTPTVSTIAAGPSWLDPTHLLLALGPWALLGAALLVFAECGILLGFFLPGDSLLFTAGLLVASGIVAAPLWAVCLLLAVAAFAGNVSGYGLGRWLGPRLLARPDGRWWRRSWVTRTEEFVGRHGPRALLLGRFVPIVRTVVAPVTGVGRLPMGRFLVWSGLGAVVWAAGVTALGAVLGGIAVVRDHLELMLVAVVVVSMIPIAVEGLRARRRARTSSSSAPSPEGR